MCLIPMMMGGGGANRNQHAPALARKMQNRLYLLGAVHFVMAITLMIAIGFPGINELFNAMILMCGAQAMHFCFMIFYIIIMFNDVVTYFSAVGYLIQIGKFAECYTTSKDCDGFQVTMMILFFIFSIAAIYVAFQAYRVFKAKDLGLLEGDLVIGGVQNQGARRDDEEHDGGYRLGAYNPPNQ